MLILTIDGKKYKISGFLVDESDWTVQVADKKITLEILREIPSHPPVLLVRADERVIRVSAQRREAPDLYLVEVNGKSLEVRLDEETISGQAREVRLVEGPLIVRSPMAGKVAAVMVSEGVSVQEGEPLIVLEAMKMENEIAAPKKGMIKEVYVKPGTLIRPGDRIVLIE